MKYEMKSFRYFASIIIALAFAAPARATEFAAGLSAQPITKPNTHH